MVTGNSRRKAGVRFGICLLLALSQLSFVACKSRPLPDDEVAPLQEESTEPTSDSVELQEMAMTRSPARMIFGKDLRPVCIIEGRIKNNSPRDITAVSIRVSVRKGNTEVDRGDLRVESLVPAGEVRSFTRQIRATPPKSGMHWTYAVTEVEMGIAEKQRNQNPN